MDVSSSLKNDSIDSSQSFQKTVLIVESFARLSDSITRDIAESLASKAIIYSCPGDLSESPSFINPVSFAKERSLHPFDWNSYSDRQDILRGIALLSPSLIIAYSDCLRFCDYIVHSRWEKRLVIIQPSFIDYSRKRLPRKPYIFFFLINNLLGVRLFPVPYKFGRCLKDATYLVFSSLEQDFVLSKKTLVVGDLFVRPRDRLSIPKIPVLRGSSADSVLVILPCLERLSEKELHGVLSVLRNLRSCLDFCSISLLVHPVDKGRLPVAFQSAQHELELNLVSCPLIDSLFMSHFNVVMSFPSFAALKASYYISPIVMIALGSPANREQLLFDSPAFAWLDPLDVTASSLSGLLAPRALFLPDSDHGNDEINTSHKREEDLAKIANLLLEFMK